MSRIALKYPNVKWVFWGFLFPWVYKDLSTDRFDFVPWLGHEAYRQRLFTIAHDISIAPLSRHSFNQSRSAIKFYESSICPRPACTVAQATGPYLDEIQDGETGLLFQGAEDFVQTLSRVIENEQERRTIAQNAKDWVLENRDAYKTVPKLYEFYQEVRENRKRSSPPPSEEEYQAFLDRAREEDRAVETADA